MLNESATDKTDEELVKLTLIDQDNFYFLVKRYQGKLLGYIRKISGLNPEDAEDLLQEVFIKIYQNLAAFDAGMKFSSWIYRITHNLVISNYRRLKTKSKMEEFLFEPEQINKLADDFNINREMERAEERAVIYQAINSLDIKYKEVLILKYFENKDYREISFILKKPLGTVGTLISRAKSNLKEQLIKKLK